MPSLSDLIERLRDAAGDFPTRDTLAIALTTSDTSMTLSSGDAHSAPALYDFDDGTFETVFASTRTSAAVRTIVRAQRGSTAAAHAVGAGVLVGFRFRLAVYRLAINQALGAISAGFGRIVWDEAQGFGTTSRMFSLPATAIGARVFSKPTGSTRLVDLPAEIVPAPASLIATGKALQLTGHNPGTGTAYISYETAWPALTLLADNLAAEFPADAEDLIISGAMAYLLDPEMFKRAAFDQPHVREGSSISQVSDLRLAANSELVRFIQRRSEVGSRYRGLEAISWVKG